MSQGAVYNLVTRDDRYDAFLTATDFLRTRLANLRTDRQKFNREYIDKYNVELLKDQRCDKRRLYEKAKVHVNVQPASSDINTSHIFYMRKIYRPYVKTASEYSIVNASGVGSRKLSNGANPTLSFTLPIFGHFLSDMCFHVVFEPLGDAAGTANYRYCSLPGIRLFKYVEFKSGGVTIDDYTRDEVLLHDKFKISKDYEEGWNCSLGQQNIKQGESPSLQGYTQCLTYKDGAQTPKKFHPKLEMWVPLHLWLCSDPSQALPNDLIPNTQRTISAKLADLSEMIAVVDPVTGIATGDQSLLADHRVNITLHVNTLYVNPEIHDILSSRIGFTLMRVHRRQVSTISTNNTSVKINLKYPCEYLFVGIRDPNNANHLDQWALMGTPPIRSDNTKLFIPTMYWNTTTGNGVCQLACREGVETVSSTLNEMVDSLALTTGAGIKLFSERAGSFYNCYLPNRYMGSTKIYSPSDKSAYFIPFCMFPGKFQPSGYFNLSASRETHLEIKSSTVSQDKPAEVIITTSALNFLTRKGDSVSLRFAV